ncbi:MAG: Fic family protein [Coriobacteriia bacterium]
MPRIVPRQWVTNEEGITGKIRTRTREYSAYVPDPLMGRQFSFTGECAAHIAEAETAIRSLHSNAVVLDRTDGLARLLLRAEAQASSRIEGVVIAAHKLLRAEAARDLDPSGVPDDLAGEVLANIDAMDLAMELADCEQTVTIETLLRIHERVLQASDLREHAGKMRVGQSWIGGSSYNPCDAAFVPPPPDEVPALLEDLAAFCNDTSLPAVAQAAIAHAQFETIHPFVDGNGRTGRAIIHVLLRRRGLAPSWCPPVSLVLATMKDDYIRVLDDFHSEAPPDSPEAVAGVDRWVSFFAQACTRSVDDAMLFEDRVGAIQADWRERLAPVRRGSSVDLLIEALPRTAILTVNQAARILDRSFTAANAAVQELVKAKVLKQVSIGKRNRAFESPEVIAAFTQLERRLASPSGDTHTAAPVRPVPWKRK